MLVIPLMTCVSFAQKNLTNEVNLRELKVDNGSEVDLTYKDPDDDKNHGRLQFCVFDTMFMGH